MKPFSVYLTEEVGSVESYLKEFGDAVASTHERFDEKGHTFFIPLNFDRSLPNKMIMAALQGDEPAGWTGLLDFVKSENPKTANITYVPILSKQVFRSGQHEDDANRNPNQRIPHDPSVEMKAFLSLIDMWLPLASGGFLDLHEDPYRGVGYMYVWSDTGDLGSRMVDIIGEDFPLFDEPDYAKATRGLITQDEQGMLGDYLARIGVRPSMTTETPAKGGYALEKRAATQVRLIKEFLK